MTNDADFFRVVSTSRLSSACRPTNLDMAHRGSVNRHLSIVTSILALIYGEVNRQMLICTSESGRPQASLTRCASKNWAIRECNSNPLRCIQYGRVDISRVGLAFLDFEVGRHSGLQSATRSPAAAADRRRCAGR